MTTGKRLTLGTAALLALFILWETVTSFVAYTSDAYVRSDLIAVSFQVAGQISDVAVIDNQFVHRGDLLAKIDPEPFQLAVNAAQETLQAATASAAAASDSLAAARDDLHAADASLTEAKQMAHRTDVLQKEGYASNEVFDANVSTLKQAQAKADAGRAAVEHGQAILAADNAEITKANAELDLAKWRLSLADHRELQAELLTVFPCRRHRLDLSGHTSLARLPSQNQRHRPSHQSTRRDRWVASLCGTHDGLDQAGTQVSSYARTGEPAG